MQGPEIPLARRRGSAGLVVHDDKFYVVGGNTIGHNGGYVAWFDEYDPTTGVWTPLADAPRARDHFHAAVANGKLYVMGGRLSGGPGGVFEPLIPEVDVYDFGSQTWSTLAPASNLPTPRAAAAVAVFDGEILVIGGEGNGQAYATVEALDPSNDTWRNLDALNHVRHGTQAITSGDGVYIAGGSPVQGGGNQKNMEVYNADLPAGVASSAGLLNAPLNVPFSLGVPEDIQLDHVAGNTGSFVQSISLSGIDAADFSITNPIADPFLIPVAGNRIVTVEYTGIGNGATASLDVDYANGDSVNVVLVPEPGALLGLGAGLIGLASLHRRRSRHAPLRAGGSPTSRPSA
jgi:N-acetylneuraminic acid mutarotase